MMVPMFFDFFCNWNQRNGCAQGDHCDRDRKQNLGKEKTAYENPIFNGRAVN
jgi:hypothetical protein